MVDFEEKKVTNSNPVMEWIWPIKARSRVSAVSFTIISKELSFGIKVSLKASSAIRPSRFKAVWAKYNGFSYNASFVIQT